MLRNLWWLRHLLHIPWNRRQIIRTAALKGKKILRSVLGALWKIITSFQICNFTQWQNKEKALLGESTEANHTNPALQRGEWDSSQLSVQGDTRGQPHIPKADTKLLMSVTQSILCSELSPPSPEDVQFHNPVGLPFSVVQKSQGSCTF